MHSEWISEADVQPLSTNGSPQGVEMGVQSSANTCFFPVFRRCHDLLSTQTGQAHGAGETAGQWSLDHTNMNVLILICAPDKPQRILKNTFTTSS